MENMKQIIYTISLILLLGACTEEKYTDTLSSGGGEPGKLVPVKLVLNTQPMQSPLSSGTKAGGSIVSSTEVCNGLKISLVETPVTRAIYADVIENFQIFQFGGTEPSSTLTWKQFINGSSVKDVVLMTSSSGAKNRIIVIANAGETTFDDLVESTATLAQFNDRVTAAYNENSKAFPTGFPLFNPGTGGAISFVGSTDMIVAGNKQADIMLYRSVARVKVNLSLSTEMQNKGYTAWTYQFMQVPKKSFFHSIGRVAAFPGETVGYANYTMQQPASLSTPIEVYLPANLHHPVPFTTPEKRASHAPAGATYLQLVGMQMNGGIVTKSVVYQIHLGSNFTDDYSILPDYSYTYTITIAGESEDDSRVIKFIPGYFSGELKMFDEDNKPTTDPDMAATWRYEKRIEVYLTDVNDPGGIKWLDGGSMPTSLNSFMDGRQNTWDLRNSTEYLALQRCFGLNGDPSPQTIDVMTWYMPSYGQSLGIYVAGSNTLKTLQNTTYWSSTANGSFAWGIQVRTGQNSVLSPQTLYNLRCIKDLD